MPKKKLEKGRALAIMGFSSSRPLDSCLGDRELIRAVLDEALFKKTQQILHAPVNHNIPLTIRMKREADRKKRQEMKRKMDSGKQR